MTPLKITTKEGPLLEPIRDSDSENSSEEGPPNPTPSKYFNVSTSPKTPPLKRPRVEQRYHHRQRSDKTKRVISFLKETVDGAQKEVHLKSGNKSIPL